MFCIVFYCIVLYSTVLYCIISGYVYDHLHGSCDVCVLLSGHHTDVSREDGVVDAEDYGNNSNRNTGRSVKYLPEWGQSGVVVKYPPSI